MARANEQPTPTRNRLGVALALAAALLLSCEGSGEKGPPVPAPAPPKPVVAVPQAVADAGVAPAPSAPAAFLQSAEGGNLEIRRAGSDQWATLKIGDPIRQGDEVRSVGGAHAVLSIDASKLEMENGASVRFRMLDPTMIQADVDGQVRATVPKDGKDTLELASAHGKGQARIRFGEVSMFADEHGASVAALGGSARLQFGEAQFNLEQGQYASTRARRIRPLRFPKKISLHVDWPQAETNKRVLPLKGKASPWARIEVQDQTFDPGPDGNFVARVKLHPGRQKIQIAALDIMGHRARQAHVIVMDPKAPDIKGEVEYQ